MSAGSRSYRLALLPCRPMYRVADAEHTILQLRALAVLVQRGEDIVGGRNLSRCGGGGPRDIPRRAIWSERDERALS